MMSNTDKLANLRDSIINARLKYEDECFCQAKSRPFDDRKGSQWASVNRNVMTENRAS